MRSKHLNLLIGAEADRRMATIELFTTAVEYKQHWGRVLAERARSGATGPEPVPHPDDIIIDSKTGEIRFDGPVSEQQWMAQERLRAMWPKLRRMLRRVDEKLKSDPKNSELRDQQKEPAKIIGWLMKDAGRRAMRDALRLRHWLGCRILIAIRSQPRRRRNGCSRWRSSALP